MDCAIHEKTIFGHTVSPWDSMATRSSGDCQNHEDLLHLLLVGIEVFSHLCSWLVSLVLS